MIRPLTLVTGALLLLGGCSASAAHDYYVDPVTGSDSAAGTSAAAAWRHAPGDPAATAKAAATVLNPGDSVRFKGGAPYRGAVVVNGDGAAGKPVSFTSYGSGNAVIDKIPTIATVITPVAMNVITAKSDRPDPRASPHTPWPLVQPLPMAVPRPTRKPAHTVAQPRNSGAAP